MSRVVRAEESIDVMKAIHSIVANLCLTSAGVLT